MSSTSKVTKQMMKRVRRDQNLYNESEDLQKDEDIKLVPISSLKVGTKIFVPLYGAASIVECKCCVHVEKSKRKVLVVYEDKTLVKPSFHLKPGY